MAISLSDIEFFLSGGSTNSNPNNSIGGAPSGFLVLGSANNLFSDISSENATAGRTDYRCFYVSNGSSTETLYDAEVYFEEQSAGGSTVYLGVRNSTEIQKISMIGPVYFGSLTLRYNTIQFSVAWGTSPAEFKTNLQFQLSLIAPGVTIESSTEGNNHYFIIEFSGASDNRSHPLLSVVSNDLLAPDTPIVTISRISDGSPINSLAPQLSVDTVSPAMVSFYESDENSKLYIGSLKPSDKVPIWIKRITPSSTDYLETDYFRFSISGRPF